jgi:hypothetical protein
MIQRFVGCLAEQGIDATEKYDELRKDAEGSLKSEDCGDCDCDYLCCF